MSYVKTALVMLVVILFILSGDIEFVGAQAPDANISVYFDTDLGQVNKGVLSSAIAKAELQEGAWDMNNDVPSPEMLAYATGMGMKYLRYSALESMDWHNAVGPDRTAEFGLPEFLQFCYAAGVTPIIIVSAKNGAASDAADLVEYLNAPDNGSNPNGGTDWAQVRAGDGHPGPWNVVWFEYGNESWAYTSADSYVINYINYRNSMRQSMSAAYPALTEEQLDDALKLGAVLGNFFWNAPAYSWNAEVVPGTGDVVDFYIIHTYVPQYTETCCNAEDTACLTTSIYGNGQWYYPPVCTISANDLFKTSFAGVNDQLENYLNELNNFIYDVTGRHVGIAITEFNGHFVQQWHLISAYRHSLGDALINAEFIRQFMHADNIIMSNYWQFANHYWGMVVGPNSYLNEEYKEFGIRPNYYPFYFYNNYFGDTLISTDGNIPSYPVAAVQTYGISSANNESIQVETIDSANLLSGNWINTPVTGAAASENNNELIINFDGTANVDYNNSHKTVNVESNTWYRLSGLIKTGSLDNGEGAYLAALDLNASNLLTNNGFESGLTDWSLNNNIHWTFEYPYSPDTEPHTGNYSARIYFPGTEDVNFYHITHQAINVQPDTTYLLEGYIKTQDIMYPTSHSNYLWYGPKLEVFDALGCARDIYYACWSVNQGLYHTTDWTRVSKEFTTTPLTNQLKVRLRRMSGTGGVISGEAWWDDIKLTKKIATDSLYSTREWRYVQVDFNTNKLNNPSELKIIAGGNARGNGIQNKSALFKDVQLREITPSLNGIVPYLSVNASKSADGKKVYLMVVNKHVTNPLTTEITVNDFMPDNARAWVLNDWRQNSVVYATNEVDNNVYAIEDNIGEVTNIFTHTFPAHSLTAITIYSDDDGDGYSSEIDCNDDDADINPGAKEICDGSDNDCDGQTDNLFLYRDFDGDGYGNPFDTADACSSPTGYIENSLDCDDSSPLVNPDALETCDDNLDNNCDGTKALCSPEGWFEQGSAETWPYRQQISISPGLTTSDLNDFPVLIRISDLSNPVFANAMGDGTDIVFTSSTGEQLDHEIDVYNAANGQLNAWVRMPVLSSGGDSIHMYYGNSSASNQQNREAVWDSSFIMVQHLSETGGQHLDSTASGHNSSTVNPPNVTTQGGVVNALIGGADEFDGDDDSVTVDDTDSLDNLIDPVNNIAGPVTIEAWFKPISNGGASGQYGIVRKKGAGGSGYRFIYDHNGNCYSNSIEFTYGNDGLCSSVDSITLNEWNHVAYTYDLTNSNLYINGTPNISPQGVSITNYDVADDVIIGKWGTAFDGFIDEVRISKTARPAEWIAAGYNNQISPESYTNFGMQEIYCTDDDNDGLSIEGGECGRQDNCPADKPVRIVGTYYSTLGSAYAMAAEGAVIQSHEESLYEDMVLDLNKTVTLQGGYSCDYYGVYGVTTLNGSIEITGGEITIRDLVIE